MKVSERLFNRLKSEGYMPTGMPFRIVQGKWERSAGGFLWVCRTEIIGATIASVFTMNQCVDAKHWSVSMEGGDMLIYPEQEAK